MLGEGSVALGYLGSCVFFHACRINRSQRNGRAQGGSTGARFNLERPTEFLEPQALPRNADTKAYFVGGSRNDGEARKPLAFVDNLQADRTVIRCQGNACLLLSAWRCTLVRPS